MYRNISIAVLLVILLSFFMSRDLYKETFIDDLEIVDADDYKEDVVTDIEPEQVDEKSMSDSMLAMQDFTTFAIKGDRGEPGEKGDKGPIGITGNKGPVGPMGESLSGSIRSSGKLWLGSDGNGASGSDNNYETQLYLGGAHNQGANNGRSGHTTYKLKIDGYDNSGSTVYPIMIKDKSNNLDFYIKNRDSPSSKPLAAVNGDLKLISSDSVLESPNIKAQNITLNNQNLSHHLMPRGSIIAFSTSTNLPHGWAVCDGNNGTPDLRGRFILGASPSKRIGTRGGEESVRLSVNEMPSHNHHMNNAGNHNHGMPTRQDDYNVSGGHGPSFGRDNGHYASRHNTLHSGNHAHHIHNAGGNRSHNNMPPYYVLVYIMKLI